MRSPIPPLLLVALLLLGSGCYRTRVVLLPPAPHVQMASWGGHYGIRAARPRYRGGHRDGVFVGGVEPESLAELMGLRAGDVIVEMQGVPCDALHRCRRGARRLQRALRARRPFELLVERRGELILIRYRYHRVRPLRM